MTDIGFSLGALQQLKETPMTRDQALRKQNFMTILHKTGWTAKKVAKVIRASEAEVNAMYDGAAAAYPSID